MAAQFLQQMYAAQQQHLMLQTAALQQHQRSPRLQSLATAHQVRPSFSPTSHSDAGPRGARVTSVECVAGLRLSEAVGVIVRRPPDPSGPGRFREYPRCSPGLIRRNPYAQKKNEPRPLSCRIQIALPAFPVTAQLVDGTQNPISGGVSATISQQAVLLGGRPANCHQAQMYLRTQMVSALFCFFDTRLEPSAAPVLLKCRSGCIFSI